MQLIHAPEHSVAMYLIGPVQSAQEQLVKMVSLFDNLKSLCLQGDQYTTICTTKCPKDHNMKSVIISQDSLYRLCGFGSTAASRYLDDQVGAHSK